jgi:hypothetical protein
MIESAIKSVRAAEKEFETNRHMLDALTGEAAESRISTLIASQQPEYRPCR